MISNEEAKWNRSTDTTTKDRTTFEVSLEVPYILDDLAPTFFSINHESSSLTPNETGGNSTSLSTSQGVQLQTVIQLMMHFHPELKP